MVSTRADEPSSDRSAVAKHRALAEQHPQLRGGGCSCCGHTGEYIVGPQLSARENFHCARCRASLRYRNQADAIVTAYGNGEGSLADLVQSLAFRSLSIYEPGVSGPFRPLFQSVAGYTTSYYWPDVEPGRGRDGIRCENLEATTFADMSFDLVVSSDIFEHIRRPTAAFMEVYRILRPGGRHIFTVPMNWPFDPRTIERVDASGADDRHLLPPVYHGAPLEPSGSLVYTDFGMDLPFRLTSLGYQVLVAHGFRNVVTFIARRPVSDREDEPT